MPTLRRVLLLALVALGLFALTHRDDAQAQRGQRSPAPPPPILHAHEWGVWIVQDGRVTIDDLAAESPPFVVRAPAALRPPDSARPTPRPNPGMRPDPVPVVRPNPVTVRKPVLFFRTTTPLDVTIDVRFAGGRPWLMYPAATTVRRDRLTWRGTVQGSGTLPAAPAGHWWNELREVAADGFTTTDGGFERFVFYDGEVRFRPLFRFTRGAPAATGTTRRPAPDRPRDAPSDPSVEPTIAPTRAAEGPLFVVRGGTYVEHDRVGGRWAEVGRGATSAMRARLRPALLARGLDEAESDSLLDVWTDELFDAGEHAVYFVPRAAYDRMLPMRITARPTLVAPDGPTRAEVRLVRVGVVIERL